jgi:hypothetical protein
MNLTKKTSLAQEQKWMLGVRGDGSWQACIPEDSHGSLNITGLR